MNSFCLYCVGGKKRRHRKEIKNCEDKDCPFYTNRFANIDHEDEKEIAQKLLGECGIIR